MANANPTRANAQLIKLLQRQLSWYYHNYTAEQTASLLSNSQNGEFIVRKEAEEGKYALCVRTNDEICIIEITSDGQNYSLQNEIHFTSIYDLLVCFTVEQHQLMDKNKGQIVLTYPFVKQYTCSGYAGRMPGQLVEKKLKDVHFVQGPCPFVISDDMTVINQFALSVLVEPNRVKHYKILCEGDHHFLDSGNSPSRKFSDLNSLVMHYRNNSLVDDEDRVIRLGQPAVANRAGPAKPPPPTKPTPHAIPLLLPGPSSAPSSASDSDKMEEEFVTLQQQDKVNQGQMSSSYAARQENKIRNRYKNIHPYDNTRVVLEDANPNIAGDDYINASIIMSNNRKAFIASQGCLPGTVAHHWRMVWQENVQIIVMVTLCVENGKNKCARYWPKSVGSGATERFAGHGFRLLLTLEDERQHGDYTIRKMTLIRENDSGDGTYKESEKRTVTQFHYTGWPDKKVPNSNDWLLSYIEKIRQHEADRTLAAHAAARKANLRASVVRGPIVVHCSAGIGRTGSFIILYQLIDMLKKDPDAEVNIMQTVSEVRRQRAGMVQTVDQYVFLYSFLDFYKKKNAAAVSAEQVQYVNYNPNQKEEDMHVYQNTIRQQHPV